MRICLICLGSLFLQAEIINNSSSNSISDRLEIPDLDPHINSVSGTHILHTKNTTSSLALLYSLLEENLKYVVKKTAMYASSTYGPYGSYQEALDASKELENNSYSESFFTVEQVNEENKPTYKV